MGTSTPGINQIICQIREVHYKQPVLPCDRCGQEASALSTATRTSIDLHLERPVIMAVTVSVHYCGECRHYFRAQPPFLRPDAIYTNRVVDRAVQSVYQDRMAIRRVSQRLARDFWVRPSEKIIRQWCRDYQSALDFETDYQAWVVSEFSGVLCVDEVYQGNLALLLAVDPVAPEGDRLVGYELLTSAVTGEEMAVFLEHLKEVGIEPDEVVTDGSSLYPKVLSEVWPRAAHQLCLFHETRRVTKGVMKLINAVRRQVPTPPATRNKRRAISGADVGKEPPAKDPGDRAVQRWQLRRAERERQIELIHYLAAQGLSQRAIVRQTGFSRPTIRKWLQLPRPESVMTQFPIEPEQSQVNASTPAPSKQNKIRRAHQLAQQGLSYSEIGRRVGAHRVTIKKWLQGPIPPEDTPAIIPLEPPSPPAPWDSWAQVKQIREALQQDRFLLLRRPEHLDETEQAKVTALLTSPIGPQLQVGRDFLVDWYQIWRDEQGERQTLTEAKARYQTWRLNNTYADVSALYQVQRRFDKAKFEPLSQFLHAANWEATNNGAERGGRAFRHRQKAHFNLRNRETISAAIKVEAFLKKEKVTTPPPERLHNCQRGRQKQTGKSITLPTPIPFIQGG